MGVWKKNDAEKRILEFEEVYDLGMVNIYFQKRDEHIIRYISEDNKLQVDYFLVRRGILKECKYCKVIPEKSVITQLKIMVIDIK